MKLVRHYLESISGVEIYPIISFIIFFSFFLVVTYMVIRMKKEYIDEVANYATDKADELPSINESE
ncbi:hypothetical protein [Carboxylicivirga marina]|uniref:CcoQ/FixQ family Cbb3-type cytochrome c oxidase assembly chaperone n=1 Tax=Carboxylicivirga marina TaxID=2800988 RepID=A0ABS1HDT4_9BACT|nr:hypothetical protein [Carboxylicivirga marina]MBK3515722.1 hypothetical protein [Carboxylicivirga marina]